MSDDKTPTPLRRFRLIETGDGAEMKADPQGAYVLYSDLSESSARKGWAIRHADGKRWRTMDTIGMPDWTDDPAKALVCRLKDHIERYAEDDPEDVRIVEVNWAVDSLPSASSALENARETVKAVRRFHFENNPPNTGLAAGFNAILAALDGAP